MCVQTLDTQRVFHVPKKPSINKTFVQRLKQYESQCWDTLIHRYAPRLRKDIGHSLRRRNMDAAWVEDIEQETWLTAVRQIPNFRWESEAKLYYWFRSIATYHIKNLSRKYQRTDISFEALDERENVGFSVDFFCCVHGLIEGSPELEVVLRENIEMLDHMLQILKPREREIFLRRLLHRESISQLAKEYRVKPETISVILVRAKQMLRAHISQ